MADAQTVSGRARKGKADGGGHTPCDTQEGPAPANPTAGRRKAAGRKDAGQSGRDTQYTCAGIFDLIRERYRRRQDLQRAELSLTLQAMALCRRMAGGDKDEGGKLYKAATAGGEHPLAPAAAAAIDPLRRAIGVIEPERLAVEKQLGNLAKQLPVAEWIEHEVRGVGMLSLAKVVGECSVPPGEYKSVSALWKRFGLAVMSDGQRQRRVGGDEAMEHGYNAARRAVIWNVGGGLVGGMGNGVRLEPGADPRDAGLTPWQVVYYDRLRYEAERVPEWRLPLAKTGKESFTKHAHNRAKRYVEKRFLRELWKRWRAIVGTATETHAHAIAAE